MPHRSDASPLMPQTRAAAKAARTLMAVTPVWVVVATGGMLLLGACGSNPVEAGPNGGVVAEADATSAQRSAGEHCRKYGKNGRLTGPLGRDSYSFVCE